jgi:hypothetical protein
LNKTEKISKKKLVKKHKNLMKNGVKSMKHNSSTSLKKFSKNVFTIESISQIVMPES